ncbi:hypothetical protein IQ241_00210 [Romeria aff. gracilis LEGE 07310]|uniref:Uncharacterized protein n=1 Tax=Vasconcelosia minhoensis LEGE 07310 TaxID=915328 RepID=A0A8J7AKH2_9CYAN|nr:hypothetical protein [Romeria gracilis]MBE9075736.1 hypothetical protein [Romeria aff. gracilis LEGE 07310]
MKITIELTPDSETRLIARAKAQGVSIEHYLNALVEHNLATEEKLFHETATTEAWVDAFTSWASGHSTNVPPLSDEAISRESIYRG